ncbi:hypothetical protein ERIC2_c32470 [Paenibacillus larvae subsp. larvae DSM 25430]|uniref:Cyclic lactone autoinducer peptide n=2 Tax=Paenibacillus larvae TaxID=1464 RepID=V9WD02_9BACL|nr:hypothetical protein ERIC2_c32470 [Paenibacillus larvae subsp. larvae DSM 25430]
MKLIRFSSNIRGAGKMKLIKLPWKALSMMAGLFAFIGANTRCWWIAHQPEVPEELHKLRKF